MKAARGIARRKSGGSGFTLIEFLSYIAVLAVIGIAVSSALLWAVRSYANVRAQGETVSSAQRALQIIAQETREALSVYSPTTSASQISLETKNNVPLGEETTFVDFYLCGQSVCMKRESQDPIAITPPAIEIEELLFTEVQTGTASSVRVSLSARYANPHDRPELRAFISLTTASSLRGL